MMTPQRDPWERFCTAYHEAAHVVAAMNVGQQLRSATIKPTPPNDYFPGTDGHVCFFGHPPPQPSDCFADSYWVETYGIVFMAGYLIEELLDPEMRVDIPPHPRSDYGRVLAVLQQVAPGQPERAAEAIAAMRAKTFRLLSLPRSIEMLHTTADLLLEHESLKGDEIYKRLTARTCYAVHPYDPEIRCTESPHPYGPHTVWERRPRSGAGYDCVPVGQFEGFSIPNSREKVSRLPGNVRRLRSVNEGGPGPRITRAWMTVTDAFTSWGAVGESEVFESGLRSSLQAAALRLNCD